MKKALTGLFFGILFIGVSACINITVDSVGDTVPAPAVRTEIALPTAIPTVTPPTGYKPYQLPSSSVLLYIPDNWVVTGVLDGEYVIFQSYPEGKYIGGEGFQPGDTKCDLSIQPDDTDLDDLMKNWKSGPLVSEICEKEVILNSGDTGTVLEIESMGRSKSLFSYIDSQAVVFSCYGELEPFDLISLTIGNIE